MNFKYYIQQTESPLPGVGLVRSYRDTYRNEKSYQVAKLKRDKFCFKPHLNRRCKTYMKYKKECYFIANLKRILCNRFPEDIVKYVLDFYYVTKKNYIPRANYYCIQRNSTYQWYILISNILYTMKEIYHENVLNIYKEIHLTYGNQCMNEANFIGIFDLFMCRLGEQKYILETGLYFKCDGTSIFDIAREYKKYLKHILYSMYCNLHL